jgi:hypothetical protein
MSPTLIGMLSVMSGLRPHRVGTGTLDRRAGY